jgi:hypothetical protein
MLTAQAEPHRHLKTEKLSADLAIIGGGAAGTCCAITAARAGLRVILIQDRPVLGGNASSEVRLWLLGATVHMGSNNRWAREGGVINEIMQENLWRNPEGNPLIFDTVLLEKVVSEKNITLLLNTACFEATKDPANPDRIHSVRAFCSQNSTIYDITAPLFTDSSGDGVLGFMAGAAFRMGAESKDEFGEAFAPQGEFGHLLGHSIYFYTKDTGRPVKFVPPSYALKNVEKKIPRYRQFNAHECGCRLWWIEYGGRLDTVHETEKIKWELWSVVYGVWDYIKNSGNFPDADNLTLEWIGHIPGKRESRRFEGEYILRQQDIVERRLHPDAVAHGGWSIDLHPADGVFAEMAGSHHLHSKGIYQIPYRCYYSRNVENLFFAGRNISTTHVAFGSTRVMATCALGGQAVAEAAAICREKNLLPRDITQPENMQLLQRRLLRSGHFIPEVNVPDPTDLALKAEVTASTSLEFSTFAPNGPLVPHNKINAQMIPLPAGSIPRFEFQGDIEKDTTLEVELRIPSTPRHHSPDTTLATLSIPLKAGKAVKIPIDFKDITLTQPGYIFLIFKENKDIQMQLSEERITGFLRLHFRWREDCSKIGGETYDVFCPERRPAGQNYAFTAQPPIKLFAPRNIQNGWQRITSQPNAWVAAQNDTNAWLKLAWKTPQKISSVQLYFDGDFDHAMETVLWGHPERAVVFGVKRYQLLDQTNKILLEEDNCHQARMEHHFPQSISTSSLTLRILETWGAPPALFELRCY